MCQNPNPCCSECSRTSGWSGSMVRLWLWGSRWIWVGSLIFKGGALLMLARVSGWSWADWMNETTPSSLVYTCCFIHASALLTVDMASCVVRYGLQGVCVGGLNYPGLIQQSLRLILINTDLYCTVSLNGICPLACMVISNACINNPLLCI